MELQIIIEIIARISKTDPSFITEKTDFTEDLGLDSLSLFEIILAIEETFDLELAPESLSEIRTVGDLENLILAYPGYFADKGRRRSYG